MVLQSTWVFTIFVTCENYQSVLMKLCQEKMEKEYLLASDVIGKTFL